eukprot:858377-Rhodomonas_salina.6
MHLCHTNPQARASERAQERESAQSRPIRTPCTRKHVTRTARHVRVTCRSRVCHVCATCASASASASPWAGRAGRRAASEAPPTASLLSLIHISEPTRPRLI